MSMSYQEMIGVTLSNEENRTEVVPVIETPDVEEIMEEGNIIATENENTRQAVAISVLDTATDVAENVGEEVSRIKEEKGTLSEEGFKMLQAIMVPLSNTYGASKVATSLESFGFTEPTPEERTDLALEGVGDFLKATWEKVVGLLMKVVDLAGKAVKFIIDKVTGIFSSKKKVVTEVANAIKEDPNKTVNVSIKLFEDVCSTEKARSITSQPLDISTFFTNKSSLHEIYAAVGDFQEFIDGKEVIRLPGYVRTLVKDLKGMNDEIIGGRKLNEAKLDEVVNMDDNTIHMGFLTWDQNWDKNASEDLDVPAKNLLVTYENIQKSFDLLKSDLTNYTARAQRMKGSAKHLITIYSNKTSGVIAESDVTATKLPLYIRNMIKSMVWANPAKTTIWYVTAIGKVLMLLSRVVPEKHNELNIKRAEILEGVSQLSDTSMKEGNKLLKL